MEISVVVNDSNKKDVAKGVARLDVDLMKKLDISAGDAITLIGERKTSAIALPSYGADKGKEIIRIDEFTRSNAKVAINDIVKVSSAQVQQAQSIIFSPIDMRLNVDEEFTSFVKKRLIDRVVTQGDIVPVLMLGHAIPFEIYRGKPQADCLQVNPNTKFLILSKPIRLSTPRLEKGIIDIKKLLRHDWLKAVSSRVGAGYVTFSILDEDDEEDTESKIINRARVAADLNLQPVETAVNFYSDKGDLIGTMPWLVVDALGTIKTTYPDIQLPPEPGYIGRIGMGAGTSMSMIRRCFKTGLNECPKEINFSPRMVFVAMPFRPNFQDIYKYAIRPALEEMGFKIWKADEKISNIDIMCKICQGIQECSYVIANISEWNANVLFEMGLAYGLGKNVILIKNRKEKVPVDLKGLEYIDYGNIDELKRNHLMFFRSIGKELQGKK